MDAAQLSLIVAVVGVVLGGASLTWNIVAWVRSGPRMELVLTQRYEPPDRERVEVLVINNGRQPGTIFEVGIASPGGLVLLPDDEQQSDGTQFPKRLEVGEHATWVLIDRRTDEPHNSNLYSGAVVPVALLASGRELRGKPLKLVDPRIEDE